MTTAAGGNMAYNGVDVRIDVSRWSVAFTIREGDKTIRYVASADSALTERSGIWFGTEQEYLDAL